MLDVFTLYLLGLLDGVRSAGGGGGRGALLLERNMVLLIMFTLHLAVMEEEHDGVEYVYIAPAWWGW